MTIISADDFPNRVHPTLYPSPEGREIASRINAIRNDMP